jgi:hypothetical protein
MGTSGRLITSKKAHRKEPDMATVTYYPDTATETQTAAPKENMTEMQTNDVSQSEAKRTRSEGLSLQKIIGKLDLISVIATILYYVRLVSYLGDVILYNGSFDYFHAVNVLAQNTGILGIVLVSFALFIMISIFYFAIRKKMRGEIGLGKMFALLIWNGIWIVGDAFMLFMVFAVR